MLPPTTHIMRYLRTALCPAAALVLLCMPAAIAQDNPVTINKAPEHSVPDPVIVVPGPPSGFEALNAPRETSVDVSYGGLPLGSFRAVYTPNSIAFYHPEEMLKQIPDIKHEDEERVVSALTGRLPTNAELICGPIKKSGCNTLKPEVAGVIFDENHFQAELFLSPTVLSIQDTHKDKILPPPANVYSAVSGINAGFTTNNDKLDYSLLSNSTYAYGPGRLNVIGIASAKQKQIDTVTGSLDKWGLDNKLGYFNSRATQLLPQTPMMGASVGTSLNTNLALRDAAGTRLAVFLPQRAYVSILYNGVIYSTDFYEAGNQILNTDSLPEGAYEVTLRIRDSSGNTTEEKRFFAKNFAIPPEDTPIYFAQAGAIRNTQSGKFTLAAGQGLITEIGTVRRITETLGGDANLVFIKNKLFSEDGMFWLLPPDHQLRASVLFSQDMDTGFGLSYLGYACEKRLSFSSDLRAIFAATKSFVADPVDPTAQSSKQWSNTVTYQVNDNTSAGLQSTYSRSGGGQGTQYSYGPQIRYDFWRSGNSNLTMTANTAQTQNGLNNAIYLQYTRRIGPWGFDGAGGSQSGKASVGGLSSNARITWNDDQTPGKLTVVGMEARHDSLSDSYSADLNHRSNLGTLRLLGTQLSNNNSNITSSNSFYSGNLGFSLINADNQIFWGGNQQQNSGLVIKNTGNSTDVPMRVMINNSEQSTFVTGQTNTLFITPYQTYKVSIKPKESSAIDYDGSVKNVTLYPGNVLPMVWTINRINVVLGHVVLPDGKPLVNAKMEEGRNISVTDEEGLFQGELLELNSITFIRSTEMEIAATGNGSRDFDIFSILPKFHPRHSVPSNMPIEEQNKEMLALYDDSAPLVDGKQSVSDEPDQDAPDVDLVVQQGILPHTKPPAKKYPPVRCRVTLPPTKEISGIYIYPEPLVCHPIPFADEHTVKPLEQKETAWSPYLAPQRVSGMLRPFLQENQDFAMALLGETLPSQSLAPEIKPLLAPPAPEKKMMIAEISATDAPATATFIPDAVPPPAASADERNAIRVQIGAYRSPSQAMDEWRGLVRKFSDLAEWEPVITRVDLVGKGTYYRLRAGAFSSKESAKEFCALLSAHGQSCILPIDTDDSYITRISAPSAPHTSLLKGVRKLPRVLPEPQALAVPVSIKQALALTVPPIGLPAIHSPLPKPSSLPATQIADNSEKDNEEAEPQNRVAEPNVVQVGAFSSEEQALEQWQALHNNVQELADRKHYIVRVDKGDKGVYYRLRVGDFMSHSDAKAFCATLIARGQACILPVKETQQEDAAVPKQLLPGLGGPYIELAGDVLTD